MIKLPDRIHAALHANGHCRGTREQSGDGFDPVPVVKFFNPLGAATWLATELYSDGDTLFGLADLGFGCPELGTFSLSEIMAIRLPYGYRIEWDNAFATTQPLSTWAETARTAGSIITAEQMLRRRAHAHAGRA